MLENHYPSRLRPLALSTVVFSSLTQTQFSSPYQPRHQASTLALTAHPRCQITDTPPFFSFPGNYWAEAVMGIVSGCVVIATVPTILKEALLKSGKKLIH